METKTRTTDIIIPYSGDGVAVQRLYDVATGYFGPENRMNRENPFVQRKLKLTPSFGTSDSPDGEWYYYSWSNYSDPDDPVNGRVSRNAVQVAMLTSVKDALTNPDNDVLQFSDVDTDSLQSIAYENMRPTLNTGFSLINFVLELKDLRGIWRDWIHVFQKEHKIWKLAKRVAKKTKKDFNHVKTWGRLSKDKAKGSSFADVWRFISEGHLTWAFALKPLISDIMKIWDNITHMREDVDRFFDEVGVTKRHYFNSVVDVITEREIPLPSIGGKSARMFGYSSSCAYSAKMEYTYQLPYLRNYWTSLLGYMDAFGLSLNAATLWNAIPFSFVIDWVTNVGDLLDSWRVDNLTATCRIEAFTHSLKSEETWVICVLSDDDLWIQVGLAIIAKYDRRLVAYPITGTQPTVTGLSTTEILLAQSLVGVRQKRKRRSYLNRHLR